jgi:hypothetical protein
MDKEKKLKIQIIVVWVVAVLLGGGMAAAWAMVLMRPLNEQLLEANTKVGTLKQTAGKLPAARESLETARVREDHLNLQLAFFRNRYRSFDFGSWDPSQNDDVNNKRREAIWRNWMREYSYNYGPRLWGEIHGAANASGVTISSLTAIDVEDPPKGPENVAIPPNGFFKPTGPLNVTVAGTLDQILTFMRRIHEGQILMRVSGGLKLEGASPRVSTTLSIQPYLVARGQNVQLSAAAAAAAAPAPGAAPPPGGAPPPATQ